MNEVSIHVSYIFGNKQNIDMEGDIKKAEELGSKRVQ